MKTTKVQLNGESIKSAIVQKILEFDPDANVRKEQALGYLATPYYFVDQLQVYPKKLAPNKYVYTYSMDIRYNPLDTSETKKQDCDQVAIELIEQLETINVGDVLIAVSPISESRAEVVDEVLHYFISYDVWIDREIVETKMQILDISVS